MMGGGLVMDQSMLFPGVVHNFVDLLQHNGGDKSLGFGSLMPQTSSGDQCVMGEGNLVDPPPDNFPDAEEDDSDDDVDDIEEPERRMWRDRMKLKRLKDLQQSRGKEQAAGGGGGAGDGLKSRQSQEQARCMHGASSSARDQSSNQRLKQRNQRQRSAAAEISDSSTAAQQATASSSSAATGRGCRRPGRR